MSAAAGGLPRGLCARVGMLVIRSKRRSRQFLRVGIDRQIETADMAAISLADLGAFLELGMPNGDLTGGAAPRHGSYEAYRSEVLLELKYCVKSPERVLHTRQRCESGNTAVSVSCQLCWCRVAFGGRRAEVRLAAATSRLALREVCRAASSSRVSSLTRSRGPCGLSIANSSQYDGDK